MSYKESIRIGTLAALLILALGPAALMGQVLGQVQARQDSGAQGMEPAAGTSYSAQTLGANAGSPAAATEKPMQTDEMSRIQTENEKRDWEIQVAKAKDRGPKRFAADLFETRQYGINPTDGGIADDYVLGVGDHLQLNVFGSATFGTPLQVDGRGEIVIPNVGTVAVGGMSLGRARSMVQEKVGKMFSPSTVDLSVTKLREVRVFVMGEVYKSGGFLVPNLSSIINVLSLAGGPTSLGSYRQIKVIRGGAVVHTVDLYPLRAYGLGNLNFGFQNGDTLFVPLIQNQIQMEGAFTRVAATVPEKAAEEAATKETDQQKTLKRNIRRIEERLGLPLPYEEKKEEDQTLTKEERDQQWEEGRLRFGANRQAAVLSSLKTQENASTTTPQYLSESAQLAALGMAQAAPNSAVLGVSRGSAELLLPAERTELEYSLDVLKDELKISEQSKGRDDQRVEEKQFDTEFSGQPQWFTRWLADGKAPVMMFEMLPGETVKDAVGFAGGFALQAFSGSVSLRRFSADGSQNVLAVPEPTMATTKVQRGDVVTALPLRGFRLKSVTVKGWARVQGVFSREDGQKVGDFLQHYAEILPDTYLERGELVHVLADGSKQFTAFDVGKALAGDPAEDLLLQDRDEINLFRNGDLRLPRFLKVVGPVSRPGNYEFIEGMRASDLLFRAGLPLEKADRYVGELAHAIKKDQYGEVVRLDLARLLSTEGKSPVDLRDNLVNPLLRPDDQISVYARPDYRPHRTVILSGQVVRPGAYDLNSPKESLRDLIARAGGLTPEAMPKAGVFLRNLRPVDPERKKASILAGLEGTDVAANGVNDILGRLNETKRNSTTGILQPNPLLHGLQSGDINRLVVDFDGILAGNPAAEVELQDGDEIIIPRQTDVVYVVGETASPFAAFKVADGMKVRDVVALAGGYTRNADTSNVRLLKADGRIVDRWVASKGVEPGDALLVPQRIKRDVNWAEEMAALTPVAILINAFK